MTRPDVLLDKDRTLEVRLEMIEQWDIQEVGYQGVAHDPTPEAVQMPRRGDADREEPMSPRLPRRRFRRIQDDLQHGRPAQAPLETDLLLGQDFSGEIGQDRADPQRLEIDSQEATVIGIEPHRYRCATPPGRAGVVLHQDAPPKEFIDVVTCRRCINVELRAR